MNTLPASQAFEPSAPDVILPTALNVIMRVPWPIKRRLVARPRAWRYFAWACRSMGWDSQRLGWHAPLNGPFAGIRTLASHPNHLWVPLGTYEPGVIDRLLHVIRVARKKSALVEVWDIGANRGLFSLACTRNGADSVLAVEPSPANLDAMRDHLTANPRLADRIEILRAAVSNFDGEVNVIQDQHDRSICQIEVAGVMNYGHADYTVIRGVPAFRIDTLAARRGSVPTILKIDVEGAEALVIEGARTLLEHHRPYVFVEVHDADAASCTLAQLRDADYDCMEVAATGDLLPLGNRAKIEYLHVLATPRA